MSCATPSRSPPSSPTPPSCSTRPSTKARTSCSRAPRALCSTSTMGRTRSSPAPTAPPAEPSPAPASVPRASAPSSESPRPTSPASAKAHSRQRSPTNQAICCARGRRPAPSHGRPRRTGWLDLPLLRYSNMINSTEWLVVTKMDVMDECAEIPVCTHYKIDGKAHRRHPG